VRVWVWCPVHRRPMWMSEKDWINMEDDRGCPAHECEEDVVLMPEPVQAAERLYGWDAAYPLAESLR